MKDRIIKMERNEGNKGGKIKTDTTKTLSKVPPVDGILKGSSLIPGRVPRTACASQDKLSGYVPQILNLLR